MSEPLCHTVLNATTSIAGILKPYRRRGILDDQDWEMIKVHLANIEEVCKEKGEDHEEA